MEGSAFLILNFVIFTMKYVNYISKIHGKISATQS